MNCNQVFDGILLDQITKSLKFQLKKKKIHVRGFKSMLYIALICMYYFYAYY
jgi:hypothetical protein